MPSSQSPRNGRCRTLHRATHGAPRSSRRRRERGRHADQGLHHGLRVGSASVNILGGLWGAGAVPSRLVAGPGVTMTGGQWSRDGDPGGERAGRVGAASIGSHAKDTSAGQRFACCPEEVASSGRGRPSKVSKVPRCQSIENTGYKDMINSRASSLLPQN